MTLIGSISINSSVWANPNCQDALVWASTKYKLNPWKELPMHQALGLCDNTDMHCSTDQYYQYETVNDWSSDYYKVANKTAELDPMTLYWFRIDSLKGDPCKKLWSRLLFCFLMTGLGPYWVWGHPILCSLLHWSLPALFCFKAVYGWCNSCKTHIKIRYTSNFKKKRASYNILYLIYNIYNKQYSMHAYPAKCTVDSVLEDKYSL